MQPGPFLQPCSQEMKKKANNQKTMRSTPSCTQTHIGHFFLSNYYVSDTVLDAWDKTKVSAQGVTINNNLHFKEDETEVLWEVL